MIASHTECPNRKFLLHRCNEPWNQKCHFGIIPRVVVDSTLPLAKPAKMDFQEIMELDVAVSQSVTTDLSCLACRGLVRAVHVSGLQWLRSDWPLSRGCRVLEQ